ncbi:MAG: hypothetical protein P8J87_19905, partial [Verrucomicrobiales bacterium]|nr:hypothetical protein [Verrucomicrobiales bacterium]
MFRFISLMILLGLATTHAQQLITPTGITQTAGNALGGYAPENLVNSAGLSSEPTLANYPSVTNAGGANNTWVTATASFPNYYNATNPPPSFLLPLPSESTLTHLVLWGYSGNNNEGSNFTLEFSTDGGTTFPSSTTVATSNLVSTASTALAFPASFDADTVRLTITDNAGGRGFSGAGSGDRVGLGEIRFIGAAAGDPGPVIDLPESIALTPDGSVQTIEIPVSNSGTTNTLTIDSTTVTGTHAAAFTVITTPDTLAPLATGTIQLSLNPTGLSGNLSATLQVASNSVLAPASTVSLSGFLHDPNLDTTPTLDFGALDPADPPLDLELTVSNTAGNNPLTIASA